MLLVTLYAGKLADRFDKRLLLLAVNTLWLVLAALMGGLVVSGRVQLWQVYVFAALWGTVSAVESPVRQAFVSELVGKALLPNALSLNAATFNTARIAGPALAGVTIAVWGTGTAFVVNAVSYVFPLLVIARMRPAELHRALSRIPAAGTPLGVAGARGGRRVRRAEHGRRPDADVPAHRAGARADRVRPGLPRAGGQPAGAARYRSGAARAGDGAVHPGLPRYQPGRRAPEAARWRLGSRTLYHALPDPLVGDDVRQLQERLHA